MPRHGLGERSLKEEFILLFFMITPMTLGGLYRASA
uniref:Uncharacterized protein n=1 Tax=Arundo donax TaxID=35708 RepID=A0A0A9AYS6_ARUDO